MTFFEPSKTSRFSAPSYLLHRPSGLYFRLRIPNDLQEILKIILLKPHL